MTRGASPPLATAAVAARVRLDEPLLPQVASMGDAYEAWVHRSVRPAASLRIFRSGALEALTHIPWWLVLLVWVPVAAGLWVGATAGLGLPVAAALPRLLAGILAWTLIEYALHRFVFHHVFRGVRGRQFHFLAHGIHHLDPWDPLRLVFPPLAGLLVATGIFGVLWLLLPVPEAMATMAGILAGYLAYDMTHYYTHHARPRTSWGKFLKRYHLEHHHKHPTRLFGVSSPLWDWVFRTGRPRAG